MRKADVIAYFGDEVQTAAALEVSKQAVNMWGEIVPRGTAYEVEVITGGALKVDRDVYRQLKARKREASAVS